MNERNLYDIAGISSEIAETVRNESISQAAPEGTRGRETPIHPPKGVYWGSPANPVGFPVGDSRLGLRNDGSVAIPSGLIPMQGLVLRDLPIPRDREYVLEGLVPTGAATSLYGDGGVAKSLLAMSLCCAVASGAGSWMGRRVDAYGAAYVDFELSADEQLRRVSALCKGSGYEEIPENLRYFCALGHDADTVFWSVYKYAIENGIGLVVIDSFGLALHGEAESAMEVIAFFKRYVEPFIEAGIGVLMIDHQPKGGDSYAKKSSFGSVYKRNLMRSMVQLEALEQDEDAGVLDLVVRQSKHNFGPLARPSGARVTFAEGEIGVEVVGLEPTQLVQEEGVKPADRVLMCFELLNEPVTQKDIADHTSMPSGQIKTVLRTLEAKGEVRRTDQRVKNSEVWESVPTGPVTYGPPTRRSNLSSARVGVRSF